MFVCVLGSTNGTILPAILAKNDNIKLVISNKKTSGILQKAHDFGIIGLHLTTEKDITNALVEHKIDYIICIGYMKILSPEFVQTWKGKLLNIHPSLLPAFAGGMNLNVHKAVLDRGCKVSGATLMYIDEGVDTGPIISQDVVHISPDETPESLKVKVQEIEAKLILAFLEKARAKTI